MIFLYSNFSWRAIPIEQGSLTRRQPSIDRMIMDPSDKLSKQFPLEQATCFSTGYGLVIRVFILLHMMLDRS